MKTYNIPQLSKPVSAIGLGTMCMHPDTQLRDFELLDCFVAGGGTYIDTAEVYGAIEQFGFAETVLGQWFSRRPDMREKVVLVSKGLIPGFCKTLHPPEGAQIKPAFIHRAISGSLKRLKTDYLDVWMFHRDDPSQPVGPLIDALDTEYKNGRIKAYGFSNWSLERIKEAIDYARSNGKREPIGCSQHFTLVKTNEPYWPDAVEVTDSDISWHIENQFPLISWSALARGFFAVSGPEDTRDANLVRTYYSANNFKRRDRAEQLALRYGLNVFEIVLSYVTSQDFPVVALSGPETTAQIQSSLKAGSTQLSRQECDWLNLTSDERPS